MQLLCSPSAPENCHSPAALKQGIAAAVRSKAGAMACNHNILNSILLDGMHLALTLMICFG